MNYEKINYIQDTCITTELNGLHRSVSSLKLSKEQLRNEQYKSNAKKIGSSFEDDRKLRMEQYLSYIATSTQQQTIPHSIMNVLVGSLQAQGSDHPTISSR